LGNESRVSSITQTKHEGYILVQEKALSHVLNEIIYCYSKTNRLQGDITRKDSPPLVDLVHLSFDDREGGGIDGNAATIITTAAETVTPAPVTAAGAELLVCIVRWSY
jgi:hypothetical protein